MKIVQICHWGWNNLHDLPDGNEFAVDNCTREANAEQISTDSGPVVPSAFFLVRGPALSGAEGNLLFRRWITKTALKVAHCLPRLLISCLLHS
jgi:hypothetical protein